MVLPPKTNQKNPKEGGDNQPPRVLLAGIHLGWEMRAPPGRTLSQTTGQTRWLARDNPETYPMTIKPETVSHVAEQFSWVHLPCCSPPGRPFPIKSLALSARVSPRIIHFRVLDKNPLLGPGRESPSCNTSMINSGGEFCWLGRPRDSILVALSLPSFTAWMFVPHPQIHMLRS